MNTQLAHIIRLAMGSNKNISIDCYTQQVTVHKIGEVKGANIGDQTQMNDLIDWLALGDSYVGQGKKDEATAHAGKAWKAEIDNKARMVRAG